MENLSSALHLVEAAAKRGAMHLTRNHQIVSDAVDDTVRQWEQAILSGKTIQSLAAWAFTRLNVALSLFSCFAPLAVLPSFVGAPAATFVPCAATGLSGNSAWISCNGTCTPTGTCRVGTGTDAIGTYKYCGCAGDSGPPTEASCCHLVARSQTQLGVRGPCTNNDPDCASEDGLVCKLAPNQPVCANPWPVLTT